MSAPALAALLCLGHFPPLATTLVGLITVFAGYTAVYALNDLVDYKVDKKKAADGGYSDDEDYLDGVMIRHPLAKGVLPFGAGLAWASGWALLAILGAYWLNPVCLYIFICGCLLETLYCKLWQVTPMRSLVNGAVKTLGAVAAVFAVDPSPSPLFLLLLFTWLFVWEFGGQNIPNDWTDIEEDRRYNAQTIPLRLGLSKATILIGCSLLAALFVNILLLWASPLAFGLYSLVTTVAINTVLLIHPAYRLYSRQTREHAMALFNKASYYPLAILILVLIRLVS